MWNFDLILGSVFLLLKVSLMGSKYHSRKIFLQLKTHGKPCTECLEVGDNSRIPIEKGDPTDFHLYIPIFCWGQFKSIADGLIHCWNSLTYIYMQSRSNFIPLCTKPDQDQVNYIPRSAPPKISEVSIRTLGRWAFTRCHSWFTRGHSWFTSGQRENKNIGEEIGPQFRKKLLY